MVPALKAAPSRSPVRTLAACQESSLSRGRKLTVLIDSWAWIGYFVGSDAGRIVRGYIEDDQEIIISTINLAEVYRWIRRYYGEAAAEEKRLVMRERCILIDVDEWVAVLTKNLIWVHYNDFNEGWMAEEIGIGIRQKLREDFLSGEPNALTDEALLELLLSYALARGNPGPLAHKLILEFGGLDNVLSSDFDALCRVKGVKSYTATLLKLAGYLRANGIAEFQPSPDQRPISPLNKEKLLHKAKVKRHKSDLFTNSVLKGLLAILCG